MVTGNIRQPYGRTDEVCFDAIPGLAGTVLPSPSMYDSLATLPKKTEDLSNIIQSGYSLAVATGVHVSSVVPVGPHEKAIAELGSWELAEYQTARKLIADISKRREQLIRIINQQNKVIEECKAVLQTRLRYFKNKLAGNVDSYNAPMNRKRKRIYFPTIQLPMDLSGLPDGRREPRHPIDVKALPVGGNTHDCTQAPENRNRKRIALPDFKASTTDPSKKLDASRDGSRHIIDLTD
ncbi:hypothetical protein K3495_g12805 [Podosphaera aphanis]|nr:hypothetical protein K3495_g12805 [Podosphaera aphanis]